MDTAITPGPCPGSGCPAPTEIDCIEVTKVYDSCFQTETFTDLYATLPTGDPCCDAIAARPTTTVTCAVTDSTCTFVSSTPTSTDDLVNATFAVCVMETITLTGPSGDTCTICLPVHFVKTATLCGPVGTTQVCTIAGVTCGPCVITPFGKVLCQLIVCLVLQSVATVQLLVPSYGPCVPSACTVLADPPCPPTPPADCTTSTTSATSMVWSQR
jgi:hypothetical protein